MLAHKQILRAYLQTVSGLEKSGTTNPILADLLLVAEGLGTAWLRHPLSSLSHFSGANSLIGMVFSSMCLIDAYIVVTHGHE